MLVEYKVEKWQAENLTECDSLLTIFIARQQAPSTYVEAVNCLTLYSTYIATNQNSIQSAEQTKSAARARVWYKTRARS